MSNLSPDQFKPVNRYTVVTEHSGGKVKRTKFDVFEDAQEHAKADNPETDGSMMPNLSPETIAKHEKRGLEYSAGGFWLGNRHAAIFRDRKHPDRYRDE